MPPVVTRVEAEGRIREVYSADGKIWACYARSGGQCYKPDVVSCPCDGWEPFLTSWGSLAGAIDDAGPSTCIVSGAMSNPPYEQWDTVGRLPSDCK